VPVGSVIHVAIAIRDLAFHQEVLDFLGRQPGIEVVSSHTDASELPEAWVSANVRPDAIIVCPTAGRALAARAEYVPHVFLVAEEMTVPALRSAIEAGAQGAFCWPEERADLAHAMSMSRRRDAFSRTRGRVIAVLGSRGGVGVTFVASHLAAALARSDRHTVLVDMDPAFGDMTAALGFTEDDGITSVEDLVAVMDELDPEHLDRAQMRHDGGFDVLLSRPPASRPESKRDAETISIPPGLYGACVALVAGDHDAVVIHVPRSLGALAKTAVRLADEVVLVTGLDLMSLYGARRTIEVLRSEAGGSPIRIVVNLARRPEVSAAEVERVLGMKPVARIRSDPSVSAAQAAGRLVGPRGGRAWRDLVALTRSLVNEQGSEVAG
jgi:pilus assembly protein CpaE